jgi:uncharacterized membrane protein
LSLEAEFESADPQWPAQLAIVAAIALHVALPGRVTVIPNWIVPVAEGVLLVALVIARRRESPFRRELGFALIGLVVAANAVTLGALINHLLDHTRTNGNSLLLSGVDIYVTGILIFAVLFWELDRGGPENRRGKMHFDFPSMHAGAHGWKPDFLDYLYLSFTNSTAFSPTDAMPLTRRAKAAMMFQSAAAVATALLVISRAINVLGA